ncbi:MAG: ABC transporter ATP-binding protein [Clostridiales bacterium]|nr:ABC transporter ATP-binding protein [Clostridiales bacterium]
MAGLSLRNITKSYPGASVAVKDFNLEIEDGEFTVFVGPSGCGTSVVLRMIAGLEDITSGELYIDGKPVNDVETRDRGIAMLFHSSALYPHMTVYENMAFGLKLCRLPNHEIDRMIRETADILELSELLDCKPEALSAIQRQRVAIGRAIVRRPGVFLMDEPFSGLDAGLRSQMRVEIARLHQKLGITMIYVTHDPEEAMILGTRLVVMKDGAIQQADTPQNLYDRPENKFVAGFIGAPQMNMIDATVGKEGSGVTLDFDGHRIVLQEEMGRPLEENGYLGKLVTFGIRPEDIHDEPAFLEASCETAFSVEVHVYEVMGAEVYLYFDINGQSCTARVEPGTTARPGDTIRIALDIASLHVFDRDSGQALAHGSACGSDPE